MTSGLGPAGPRRHVRDPSGITGYGGDGADTGPTYARRFPPLPLREPPADAQDAWPGYVEA
ncbi:hypothetical protein [Streptomyces atroolivaceus]|uniref:hypothetical protein n=1 Tax=Streptomyces atroolivaceus TaxID=66869 RepID=UPI003631E017